MNTFRPKSILSIILSLILVVGLMPSMLWLSSAKAESEENISSQELSTQEKSLNKGSNLQEKQNPTEKQAPEPEQYVPRQEQLNTQEPQPSEEVAEVPAVVADVDVEETPSNDTYCELWQDGELKESISEDTSLSDVINTKCGTTASVLKFTKDYTVASTINISVNADITFISKDAENNVNTT